MSALAVQNFPVDLTVYVAVSAEDHHSPKPFLVLALLPLPAGNLVVSIGYPFGVKRDECN